jgi:hypothetical protein
VKSVMRLTAALLLACALGACANFIHKPTTTGNAGVAALVTYGVSGAAAGTYFALPLCATHPVYPCKTQAANDRLDAADQAAHDAAIAADKAATAGNKQAAADKKAELDKQLADPEIKKQIDLAKAKTGGAP